MRTRCLGLVGAALATTAFAVFAVPHASADEIFTYTSANYSGSLGNNITASATLSCAGACMTVIISSGQD